MPRIKLPTRAVPPPLPHRPEPDLAEYARRFDVALGRKSLVSRLGPEELLKMARLTSAKVADRMIPHTPSDREGIDRVESFDLGQGLWHHVVHKGKMDSGFEPLLHTLSLSPDPYDEVQVISSASANRQPADQFWGDPRNTQRAGANLPWRDGLIPTQGEVATERNYQGRGYGTRLYQEMLKYHGRLASDSGVSRAANKVWRRLGSNKSPLPMQDASFRPTKVFFGAKPNERHWAEYGGPRPTPATVRHQGGYSHSELEEMKREIDRDMSLADRETDQYGDPVPQQFRDSWREDALRRKTHLDEMLSGRRTGWAKSEVEAVRKKVRETCRCDRYHFPHRKGGGLCR